MNSSATRIISSALACGFWRTLRLPSSASCSIARTPFRSFTFTGRMLCLRCPVSRRRRAGRPAELDRFDPEPALPGTRYVRSRVDATARIAEDTSCGHSRHAGPTPKPVGTAREHRVRRRCRRDRRPVRVLDDRRMAPLDRARRFWPDPPKRAGREEADRRRIGGTQILTAYPGWERNGHVLGRLPRKAVSPHGAAVNRPQSGS